MPCGFCSPKGRACISRTRTLNRAGEPRCRWHGGEYFLAEVLDGLMSLLAPHRVSHIPRNNHANVFGYFIPMTETYSPRVYSYPIQKCDDLFVWVFSTIDAMDMYKEFDPTVNAYVGRITDHDDFMRTINAAVLEGKNIRLGVDPRLSAIRYIFTWYEIGIEFPPPPDDE